MLSSTKVDALISKIKSLLGNDFDGAIGLRGDSELFEIGTELNNSRYWGDEYEDDYGEELDGTSAIIISGDWRYDDESVIESNIRKYAENVLSYGDYYFLVVGDLGKGGDDIAEIVIPNATVIAHIERSEIEND